MIKNKEAYKSVGRAIFDVVTLGIPLNIRSWFKQPKETFKLTLMIFPIHMVDLFSVKTFSSTRILSNN